MAREQITFQCTECKRKNYTSMKTVSYTHLDVYKRQAFRAVYRVVFRVVPSGGVRRCMS